MQVRKKYPFPINWFYKLFMGWCFLLFLFGILIFPLLLFSTFSPNYIIQPPTKASLNIKVWGV